MTIDYTTGHYSMTIDNIQFVDKSLEECKEIVHKLVDKTDDVSLLQQFVEHFMETYGEFTDLGTCETCGDWIENYKYQC